MQQRFKYAHAVGYVAAVDAEENGIGRCAPGSQREEHNLGLREKISFAVSEIGVRAIPVGRAEILAHKPLVLIAS